MGKMKQKYLEEYEKYKNINIEFRTYRLKSNRRILYEVLDIDEKLQRVLIKTVSSGVEQSKTLHWCRKNLEPHENV